MLTVYTFYRLTDSPTTKNIPTLVRVRATSREAAVEGFARKFGLKVVEVSDTVWFSADDGDWQYDVRETQKSPHSEE